MYESPNEIFENKFIILLAVSLLTTYSIHMMASRVDSPVLAPNHWFADDSFIESVLRENVDTNYTYLEVSSPHFIKSFNGGVSPFFAEYDIWYRYFNFYPYDPETTPPDENYRIDGVIFIDGRIRIYGHVTADTMYI